MTIESINRDLCTKCGICEAVCPQDVIRMDAESGFPYIAYKDDCSVCFICEQDCPEDAIFVDPLHSGLVVFPYGR